MGIGMKILYPLRSDNGTENDCAKNASAKKETTRPGVVLGLKKYVLNVYNRQPKRNY